MIANNILKSRSVRVEGGQDERYPNPEMAGSAKKHRNETRNPVADRAPRDRAASGFSPLHVFSLTSFSDTSCHCPLGRKYLGFVDHSEFTPLASVDIPVWLIRDRGLAMPIYSPLHSAFPGPVHPLCTLMETSRGVSGHNGPVSDQSCRLSEILLVSLCFE